MLRASNEILRVQSRPTRETAEKSRMILDYAATYPNVMLRYKASDMVLHVDSDAAYLTMIEEQSSYAGNSYLSDWPSPSQIKPNPNRNGPIHTECKKIRNVVSSAAKDETCGTFNSGKTAINMQPQGYFYIGRDLSVMWCILGSFWLRMLKPIQRFRHIST